MAWRQWNRIIHRDLGYLCCGLTVIYALSGVAVNHIAQWNPTYRITREENRITLPDPLPGRGELVPLILGQVGERGTLKDTFQPAPDTLQIFVENNTMTVNLTTGRVTQEKNSKRPLLYQANFLHLNHPKKMWTWFADIYAIALSILAISGLFMLRGGTGITGRGAWLTVAGLALPLFFLWLYA